MHFFLPQLQRLRTGVRLFELGKFHPLARELPVLADRMIAP
jgi:hypothetical protein